MKASRLRQIVRSHGCAMFVPIRATRSRVALPSLGWERPLPSGVPCALWRACGSTSPVLSVSGLQLGLSPHEGVQAWLLCVMWPGPRAVRRDRGRAHLLGLCWRMRSLHERLLYAEWRGLLCGGPKQRREERRVRALLPSQPTTNYKVSYTTPYT